MSDDSVMSTSLLTPNTSHHSNQQSSTPTSYTPESVFSLPGGIRCRLLHVGERVLGPTHHTSQSNGVPLALGSVEAVEKIHRLLNGLGVQGYSAQEVENVWMYYARSKGGYQDPLRYPWSPVGSRDGEMLAGSSGSLDPEGGELEDGDEDLENIQIIGNLQQAFEDGNLSSIPPHIEYDTKFTQTDDHNDYAPVNPKCERKRKRSPPGRTHRKRITHSASLPPSPNVSFGSDKPPPKRTRRSAHEEEWTEAEYCALVGAIVEAAGEPGKHWNVIATEVKKFSPKGIDRHADICKKTFAITEKPRFEEFATQGILYTPGHLRAAGNGPRSWALDEKRALWKGLIVQGAKRCDWKEVKKEVNKVGTEKRSLEQIKKMFDERLKKKYL